jgi:hypothetical protein
MHGTSNRVVNASTAVKRSYKSRAASDPRPQNVSPQKHFSFVRASKRIRSNVWIHLFLMCLILLQLAVLIADTTDQDKKYWNRPSTFGSRWKDPCYFVIFLFYTLEVVLKTATLYDTKHKKTKVKSLVTLKNFYNTLDILAVVSFWISFIMLVAGARASRFRQVLAMLSCLRILRLLLITPSTYSETAVLFEALRESGPKLAKVASFIGFFWLLFAVIGVQSFKSSLKRSCVVSKTGISGLFAAGPEERLQYCGGHYIYTSSSLNIRPWLRVDGTPGALKHKGYLCPPGMVCQESANPYNDTVSFDNIFQSLELVFVTFSANTFSTLMYNVMDSEGLPAALFFAAVIIILYFWLLVLLIGIITGSIQEVRQRSQLALRAQARTSIQSSVAAEFRPHDRALNSMQKAFMKTKWLWIVIITYGLVAQAYRSTTMSLYRRSFVENSEKIVTLVLLFEIVLRIALDWKRFHHSKRNMTDLGLALVTSLVQIPALQHQYRIYPWLTGFQIARSYRIFWAIAPVRDIMVSIIARQTCACLLNLQMASFRYFPALLQLCEFLTLLVFFSSVLATQLFVQIDLERGVAADEPFSDLWKSFLGMYQIFTGEDWTQQLYAVTQRDSGTYMGWIGAIFIIGWFAVSSIIILNMFLSRIDDSLDIPEDRKRILQVEKFFSNASSSSTRQALSHHNRNSKTYASIGINAGAWTEPHVESAIDKFLDDDKIWKQSLATAYHSADQDKRGALQAWIYDRLTKIRIVWQAIIHFGNFQRMMPYSRPMKKSYILLQEFCKTLLNENGQGPRYSFGNLFQAFINMAIVAQVLITSVTTPLYQRSYWIMHTYAIRNWIVVVNLGFAILWTFEAVIKTIAGGLFAGPHAYLRGWNLIDAIVLVTSWTSLAFSFLSFKPEIAFMMASFSAFRVLRLLTLNKKIMREITLVFRRGSYKIIASILVSLSLLIPFAVFAVNLFIGQSSSCNDPNIINYNDCVGEFVDPAGARLLTPRLVSQPYYSFNSFGQSFYTLFLIVSQEGWTDVMYWARGVSGAIFSAQNPNATSNMNALFFVVFNLLGTIFVTALFASVMIQNYTEATGVAYLTYNQKVWTEHARLLRQVRPLRYPTNSKDLGPWHKWCYSFAIGKEEKWHRIIVTIYLLYMIFLCVNFYPGMDSLDMARGKTVSKILRCHAATDMSQQTSRFWLSCYSCY